MMRSYFYALSVASLVRRTFAIPTDFANYGYTNAMKVRADPGDNPIDLSVIKKYTSIGDSFAAGIGAGKRTDWSCSRYDHSYPYLVFSDDRMGDIGGRSFQPISCSGATAVDVLKKQIPKISNGAVDALTISAGGNDVGLSSILNDCIFGWLAQKTATCDATLQSTQDKINNDLPGALQNLLSAALPKLTPNTGRIYYTGYAKFFNAESTQCNSASFVFWNDKDVKDEYKDSLSNSRRKQYNDLVDGVNSKIKEAVANAGSQAVFVAYDNYFAGWGGRYCEEGVTEPSPDANYLLWYERGTSDHSFPFKIKRDDPVSDPDDVVPDGSFEGEVASLIEQELEKNPDWKIDLLEGEIEELHTGQPPVSQSLNLALKTSDTVELSSGLGGLSWWLPDKVKRVFHPQPNGHAIIANLILYHMEVEIGKQLGYTSGDNEDVPAKTCPGNPFNSTSYPTCSYHSASYVPKQLKNPSDQSLTDPNGLLIVLRQNSCTNACSIPDNFPGGVISRWQSADQNECELSVALPNNVEAYVYRGTPSTGSQWQNCWDSYWNIIDQCVAQGPNQGWVNGPDPYEFFQAGFRPMNDPAGKHSASNPLSSTYTFIDTNPPDPDTTGWTCKDNDRPCPEDMSSNAFKEKWCIDNCGCWKYTTGEPPIEVFSCPL